MKRNEFFNRIIELLNSKDNLSEQSVIADISEWDSLMSLEIIQLFVDCCGKAPDIDEIRKCVTIGDILNLANLED